MTRNFPILIALSLLILTGPQARAAGDYASRPEVRAFVQEMVKDEGFDKDSLLAVFADANYEQSIIDAISRPAEKVLTWKEYQDIFLTAKRVDEGKAFLRDNAQVLSRAQEKYGVPPEVVGAIIGVETMYGRFRGKYRVIDALSTLAFDYPPRASFFRGELKQFLLLAREEKASPETPLGSYAGAMGYGQFIPSSYRHYAVDFDGDGFRDIWNNPVDAIGSVANYLAVHGWERGGPVTTQASSHNAPEGVFGDELEPSTTVGALVDAGFDAPGDLPADLGVAPILLHGKAGPEYWLGFHNFYVISRYNHSKLYAMAVYQLSRRLGEAPLVASH